ncbi:probable glutathione S-transferase [Corylus avellana]|uniref:probable glutathione S-transferase n=1 Tax=Corylus avellana TaxID=13451 RepID=UPI00286D3B92|nr:probable glutathione S-transferase [Corylus avellana]XP_059463219.1 probable glutathione S-transferase [Corylus avellana]
MAEEVLLFGVWASPYSRRVELALKLKGVDYKYIEEDLTNKSPLLLKYNPIHKKIPVLVHNGKPIVESQVIQYIDEIWQGYPILPKDPYERAIARFWAKFIDDKCLPGAFKAYLGEEKEREKAVEETWEALKILEEELKEKRFFGGESIGMVDIVANAIAFWLGVFEEASGVKLLTREKFPKLTNWSHEFVSSIVVKECLPPREKLIAYFRNRFGGANASK